MQELKACPFCGSKDLEVETTMLVDGIVSGGYVVCRTCDATGPEFYVRNSKDAGPDRVNDIIEKWNTRRLVVED